MDWKRIGSVTVKKSSDRVQAIAQMQSGDAATPPRPHQTPTHPEHKEAFAALLGLAAKPLDKTDK